MREQKIKIAFFGTPEFALPALQTLAENKEFEILAVLTQEDKKTGRHQALTAPPVKILAQKYGLPVLQPLKINDPAFLKILKGLAPDFLVVIAYGKILPKSILEIPRYAAINVHASLLPKYRGASPIEETLLHGDKETGISIMKMEEALDSGPVYYLKKLTIEALDTADSLRKKLSIMGAQILPYLLRDIRENNLHPLKQDKSKTTYCHKITKEAGLVNLTTMTAQEIWNRIRAYTPWPSCYLFLNGKRLKILEASYDEKQNGPPGTVVDIDKNTIGIGTKKGLLFPKKVQLEGKAAMDIQTFLMGNRSFLKKLLTSPK